jgi:phosphoacetylglucosamine mutase
VLMTWQAMSAGPYNEVGAAKLAQLASVIKDVSEGRELLKLSLRNTEGLPGSLNNKVGADFVQKEKCAPAEGGFASLPPGAR